MRSRLGLVRIPRHYDEPVRRDLAYFASQALLVVRAFPCARRGEIRARDALGAPETPQRFGISFCSLVFAENSVVALPSAVRR